MLLESLQIPTSEFESGTGWQIKPEGACKGDICIPLKNSPDDLVDIEQIAIDMNLPLVAEAEHEDKLKQELQECWQGYTNNAVAKFSASAVTQQLKLAWTTSTQV